MDKFFKNLREKPELFRLKGSTLIVKLIEEELKTEGGIVIASSSEQLKGGTDEHRLNVAEVLMAGEGYVDDEGNPEPLDCQPGAIVVLPKFGMSLISVFPGLNEPTGEKLAMVKEDQILCYYPTKEAYEQAKKELN